MRVSPSVLLTYICVARGGERTYNYAARFVGSFLANPPGVECKIVVCCNGGAPDSEVALLFSPLTEAAEKCSLHYRPTDYGKDLSAYQDVAGRCKSDILVNFGESIYFHKPGWMLPVVSAWEEYGPGMYGFFSSHLVRPHLNTTAFACAPEHLTNYPTITKHQQRYEFEHGKGSLWKTLQKRHVPTALVCWDGIYGPGDWRKGNNIMWRGDQSNLLIWCNHVDRWFEADAETKFKWSAGADMTSEMEGKP